MHFYKRDLTPVKENYAFCNDKTPYKQNFQNYEGSLMSKTLKNELLNSFGGQARCVSSSVSSKRFSTFQILTDVVKKNKNLMNQSQVISINKELEECASPIDIKRGTNTNWGKMLKNRR